MLTSTKRSRPAALAGDITGIDSFFPGTDIDFVPVCHLADGTAMIMMELSCVPVPDIGQGRAADQEQYGCKSKYAFHVEYSSAKTSCHYVMTTKSYSKILESYSTYSKKSNE